MNAIISSGQHLFEHLKQTDADGREFWSGRDLQAAMGYVEWRKFEDAIERAMAACENSGAAAQDHFGGAAKMVGIGSGASRKVLDWHLTRYAAYLVAMNGDPRKPEIAAAQTYFAVKTREAETARPAELSRGQILRLALAAEEEAERLRAERAELSGRVAELEPAAAAWDRLASADQDFSVREAAHILNRDPNIDTGERRLFAVLRGMGLIDRQDRPYQRHAKHVRLRPRSYSDRATGVEMAGRPQVRVTAPGLRYLHSKLGGAAPLRFDQLPLDPAA